MLTGAPEYAHLKTIGRTIVGTCDDADAIDAFYKLSQLEGIIPALETSHAIAYLLKMKKFLKKKDIVIVCLSGRGDKDMEMVSRLGVL